MCTADDLAGDKQTLHIPRQQGTKLTIAAPRPTNIAIHLRVPYWAQGGSVKVNGQALPVFASPSSYLTLRGPWKNGDSIELSLPMGLHSWRMPDDDTVQAPMYGPLVLAARHEEAPKDRWYGDTGPFERRAPGTPPPPLPGADGKVEDAGTWIEPAGGTDAHLFKAKGQAGEVALVPVNSILHERYDVYWKLTPPAPAFQRRS
jgi:hypothetical protein